MIRAAREDDIPRIVEMGLRFRRESSYRDHIAENTAQVKMLAAKLVFEGICLVIEHDGKVCGLIGIMTFPHFISGELIAGEVAWWVEPEHRGSGVKLVREAEKRARAAGAKRFQMIAPTVQVGSVYKRLGYEFVESAYEKQL